MVKKSDLRKWLKIRLAKDNNPKLRIRDMQNRFHASPNLVVEALKHSKVEIEDMIKNDVRYSKTDFGDIDNKDVEIEQISANGFMGYIVPEVKRPRRDDIETSKLWITHLLEPTDAERLGLNSENFSPFFLETTSYGMKHWLEIDLELIYPGKWNWKRTYVTNGAFIVAMLEEGYIGRVNPEQGGPNVFFNVDPSGFFNALGQTSVLQQKDMSLLMYASLRRIEVHNADNTCSNQYCSLPPTHYLPLPVGTHEGGCEGEVLIPFCYKHGSYFEGVSKAISHLLSNNMSL